MTFCGQCGLRLAPGETRCPRCGTFMEPDVSTTTPPLPVDEYEPNAPTTQSPSVFARQSQPGSQAQPPLGAPTPQNQQKLVLPSIEDRTNQGYSTQGGYDPTMRQQGSSGVTARNPYPGYPPQTSGNYTPVQHSYPGSLPPQGSIPQTSGPYQDYQYQGHAPTNARGRTAALVLILVGLLFILIALTLFIFQHNGTLASKSNVTISSSATAVPITQRARGLIQLYYDNINKRAYRAAYDLWKPGALKQSFASFQAGFQHTVHDRVTFNGIAEQSDGTIKVSVTIDATETAASNTGTTYSTYQGYYIVEPQSDGSLLIINGTLHAV